MRFISIIALLMLCVHAWANTGIQIINFDGQPIAGAEVIIGNDVDDPFRGNVVVTDANGFLPMVSEWRTSLPLTVNAKDYVSTSFLNVSQKDQILRIQKADGTSKIEVKGETTGYGRLRRDGKVDVSMIFPAMERRQLLSFNVSSVMSPENDIMNIVGRKVEVPSNLSIPKQKESYILPITLDKPVYRFYFNQPGTYRLTGAHCQFPLKKVVDDLRGGKSFFEVLNHFKFLGAGQLDLNVSSNISGKNISVDQMKFNKRINVKAPAYDSSKYTMVAMALVDQGGLLFPSDIKKVNPSKMHALSYPQHNGDNYTLSILSPPIATKAAMDLGEEFHMWLSGDQYDAENDLRHYDFKLYTVEPEASREPAGLSFVLQNANVAQVSNFLDIVAPPQFNNNVLTMTPPKAVSGVTPLGTYMILAKQTTLANGSKVRTRLWEISAKNWTTNVDLPRYNLTKEPNTTYRWEVYFLGSNQNNGGENPLENITHMSRSFIEF